MFNFFAKKESRQGGFFVIGGSDYNHIKNVLRMKIGENFLVSAEGQSHLCSVSEFTENTVIAKIIEENYKDTSLCVDIHLFQGLPKGDKMEQIIQKCVELGVTSITPVEMENCVVRLEEKKKAQKVSRWQAICESAAKQSKRNFVPEICPVASYKNALAIAEKYDKIIVPYENKEGMKATKEMLNSLKKGMSVAIFIGPEGGFSEKEIDLALEKGFCAVSLGKRILRTETAAVTACAMVMLYAETELE